MPYNLTIPGWMSEGELRHIESLAAQVPATGKVLEVGSFLGRSAWAWAKSVPLTATVHCIDFWHGFEISVYGEPDPPADPGMRLDVEQFLHYTHDCPNIIYTRGDANAILPRLERGSYSLVFLDGGHENPTFRNTLHRGFALLQEHGVLCGHDFVGNFPDIILETRRFSARHNLPISFALDSAIWVMHYQGQTKMALEKPEP